MHFYVELGGAVFCTLSCVVYDGYMKVVLLKDAKGVGKRGAVIEVADGYALNFLLPRKMAIQGTKEKIAAAEMMMQKEAQLILAQEGQWQEWAERLSDAHVSIKAKANDRGHLYKQLTPAEIAEAIHVQTGILLPVGSVTLKSSIKSMGESTIQIRLGNYKAQLVLEVQALQ